MLLCRDEWIGALFRETERAQRMKTPLSLILVGISDWLELRSGLETGALGEVEEHLASQVIRLLRCYDVAGWRHDGELGLILPGCTSFSAVGMAERLSTVIVGTAIRVGREDVHLQACFGVAGSGGRSPLVVLRNAEEALRRARARGAGSIERSSYDAEPDPATFLMPVIEDEALHW